MKNFLVLLLFVPSFSSGEPYRTSPESQPYVCTSGAAAYDAWHRNYASRDAAADLLENKTCRKVQGWPEGTRFRVISEYKDKDIFYTQVEIIGEPSNEGPLFISGGLNPPIDPEAQARQKELAKLPIGCTLPAGGQVNRLERGKDGQVYMKSYMITSKCVDGQMKSFTKPLN